MEKKIGLKTKLLRGIGLAGASAAIFAAIFSLPLISGDRESAYGGTTKYASGSSLFSQGRGKIVSVTYYPHKSFLGLNRGAPESWDINLKDGRRIIIEESKKDGSINKLEIQNEYGKKEVDLTKDGGKLGEKSVSSYDSRKMLATYSDVLASARKISGKDSVSNKKVLDKKMYELRQDLETYQTK